MENVKKRNYYYCLFNGANEGIKNIEDILGKEYIENDNGLPLGDMAVKNIAYEDSYVKTYMPVNLGLLLNLPSYRTFKAYSNPEVRKFHDAVEVYGDINLRNINGIIVPVDSVVKSDINFVSFFDERLCNVLDRDEFHEYYRASSLAYLYENDRIEYMKEYILRLKQILKTYQSDLELYKVNDDKKLSLKKL